jgi:hypothetical protein
MSALALLGGGNLHWGGASVTVHPTRMRVLVGRNISTLVIRGSIRVSLLREQKRHCDQLDSRSRCACAQGFIQRRLDVKHLACCVRSYLPNWAEFLEEHAKVHSGRRRVCIVYYRVQAWAS